MLIFCLCACTNMFLSCLCAEIELYPPELSVMDCNLTMISCVTRFNSNETEPGIYFRYNEIWITSGFNYTGQTNNGLSPPHHVPCPPLYADNRGCTAFLMYVVGTPKINGSSLMCTAAFNGTRKNSTTVTIKVMTTEGKFCFLACYHLCRLFLVSTPPLLSLQRGKRNLVTIVQLFWNSSGRSDWLICHLYWASSPQTIYPYFRLIYHTS